MKKMKDFEIRCDASHLEISSNNNSHTLYGKFTLGPFLPGQGTTFGNALRRSLLSELSGLAITAFEILGVMQEFSTLPGLRESVLDLSLNLKQVVLTGILPHSIPPIGFLKRKGPAVIKAVDLKLPAGVYCTSPDQYIATLASNGDLSLKFLVSVGKGYSVQPYSLYRSLSKIRLQPTLEVLRSSLTEGKTTSQIESEQSDSLENSDSIPNLRATNAMQTNVASQRLQNDNSEYTSSASKHSRPNRTDFSVAHPASHLRIPKVTNSTDAKCKGKQKNNKGYRRSENELESSVNPIVYQTDNLLSSYPRRGSNWVAETTQDNHNFNEKFLQSTNSEPFEVAKEFVNPIDSLHTDKSESNSNKSSHSRESSSSETSLISSKNANNTTFAYQTYVHSSGSQHSNFLEGNKRFVDPSGSIQTQIFQRVNPHQVLPIDAVFTPVSRVNFLTQVNDRFETARENIVLEIWTNGSIHPKRALEEATLLLVQNFDTLLKKIQQASSIYKGLHYVNNLHTQSNAYSIPQKGRTAFTSGIPVYTDKSVSKQPFLPSATFGMQRGNYIPKVARPEKLDFSEPGTLSNSENMASPHLQTEEAANNKRNALHTEGSPTKEAVNNALADLTKSGMQPKDMQTRDDGGQPKAPFAMQQKGLAKQPLVPIPLRGKLCKGESQGQTKTTLGMPPFREPQGDNTSTQAVEKKGVAFFEQLSSEFSKQHMNQAIFNLDIGNFNFSLQTFIALKEAKIHTLSQLLTFFSLEDNKIDLNSKSFLSLCYPEGSAPECKEIERSLLLKEKIVDELKNVVGHFIIIN